MRPLSKTGHAPKRAAHGGNFVTEVPLSDPDKRSDDMRGSRPLGPAGWFAIVVLAGFLVAAILYAAHSWNELAGTPIPPLGWLFMALGAIVTLVVGAGLMALLFYSSRKGKDF
jgi:hypothetical protein